MSTLGATTPLTVLAMPVAFDEQCVEIGRVVDEVVADDGEIVDRTHPKSLVTSAYTLVTAAASVNIRSVPEDACWSCRAAR